ncbi:MAG: TonB-dependent receptor [Prevotella sp.]|nr:TonB-dependent receptor [Prevotella sp.]
MKKRLTMFMAAFFLCLGGVIAQTKVTGTVLSQDDGQPIIGAAVSVVGTKTGGLTDTNGRFSVTLPEGKKDIRVSYLGYESKTVQAKNGMRVFLKSDAKALDDVIVVGYGTQRREAKTGSITTVAGEELSEIPAVSVDKMLAGKLAGVMVTQNSGQPGSASSIRIRGTSSITAGNNPLYVIDGIAVSSDDDSELGNDYSGNPISLLNPNDIESITVLKDAAAASVYGSRAANGVILITTKSGKEGKSMFTVRAKYGVSQLANDNDYGVMTGQELLEYQRDAIHNAGMDPDDPTSSYYRPYELLTRPLMNWMEHLTRTGHNQEYEINMSGGSAKTKYYNSVSYNKTEGVVYGNDFKRIQARINADHEINQHFQTGVRINAGYRQSNDIPMQSLYYANPIFAGQTIMPWMQAYTEDGMHNTDLPENAYTNPRATAQYDQQWDKKYNFIGNFYLEFKPIKQLSIKTTNAADMTFGEGRRYWSLEASNYDEGYPILQTTQSQKRVLTTSNTATWTDTYFEKHNVRLLAGQEAISTYWWQNYQSIGELNPDIPYLPSGNKSGSNFDADYDTYKDAMLSFFGILDYNFDSRYYLQASIRTDGSSLFGKNKQWGTFWSVGLSWNMHNEKFMKNLKAIDVLKIRASYGVNGNNNIDHYQQYGTYTSTIYNGLTGMRPSTPANDDLSWEKNYSWNVGVDFRVFKILSGSIDVYSRKTTDMLLEKQQSSTSGFNTALTNVGSMRNTGVEFQLDAQIINKQDWKWDIGFNIAHNKSKILELAGDEMMGTGLTRYIVGERLLTFYLKDYYGVNPVNGEPLWRNEAGELTNNYNEAAYVKSGSPEPKVTGGINTTVSWKDLSLSIVGEFKAGNKVFIQENRYLQSDGNQMSMNQSKSALNYWKKPGDTGCNPKPIAGNTNNGYAYYNNRFVEKGDYFRIKDITLSYMLPRTLISKIGIGATKIYASGLNVYTFHDVNFWDPERGVGGMGAGIYPVCKSFVVGLDVSF